MRRALFIKNSDTKHLKLFNFDVTVHFFTEKRNCLNCKKVRSELIEWLCPKTPHITMDLAG